MRWKKHRHHAIAACDASRRCELGRSGACPSEDACRPKPGTVLFRVAHGPSGIQRGTGNSNGKLAGSMLGAKRLTTRSEFEVPMGVDGPSTTK